MCDAGPGSHIACRSFSTTKFRSLCYSAYFLICQDLVDKIRDAGPGSHIARGNFLSSKNVRRGTGVPHRMSKFLSNEVPIFVLLCVFSHMPRHHRQNPRRGTGVPTSHAATFLFLKMCDAGPGSHIACRSYSASTWQSLYVLYVFLTCQDFVEKIRDAGPDSHIARRHALRMCDASPITWRSFSATKCTSQG